MSVRRFGGADFDRDGPLRPVSYRGNFMGLDGVYCDFIIPLARWLGEIIEKLFPWPAVVLFVLIFPPTRAAIREFASGLTEFVTMIRAVKAAGVELSLDPNSARRVVGSSTEIVVAAFRAATDDACRKAGIWGKFERVIESVIVEELKKNHAAIPHFRATIYILDGVYVETTYQLVEYLHRPDSQTRPTERPITRGRRLSIRFGIVGRAWRLGVSDYDPDVSTDPSDLIRNWGMTHEEASTAGRGRKSFAVFLVRDAEQHPLAGVYLDSETANLLGPHTNGAIFQNLDQKFATAAATQGLADALIKIVSSLAAAYPRPMKKLS